MKTQIENIILESFGVSSINVTKLNESTFLAYGKWGKESVCFVAKIKNNTISIKRNY